MTPEGKLKADVLDALKPLEAMKRIKVIRQQSGSVRVKRGYMQLAPAGTPDLLVMCGGGRSVWIELKRDDVSEKSATGKARREKQQQWRDEAKALGHEAHVCRSEAEVMAVVLEGLR